MNKLDIYISKKFLFTLLFALITFTVFFIIIDMVEYLDKFIDQQVPKNIIADYYLYYIPYMVVLIMPIAILLASLFSVGQLARYNELTAMQTSGISLYRIAFPLILIGFIISLAMFYFGEYVVPEAARKKFAIKRQYLDRVPRQITGKQNNISVLQSENERTNIAYFDVETNIAHDVTEQKYASGRLLTRLDAKRMIWRDGKWILQDGISRDFSNNREVVKQFSEKELTNFPFDLADLKKAQKQPDEMNSKELKKFIGQIIHNGADPQKWLVDLNLKYAFPFTNFIIILFGIPLASLQKRSGAALGFGISLAICFIFFGMVKTLQAFGHNGLLNPVVSAWGSNLFFGTIGILLMVKAKK
ncbi:MAG TPA: YjgP/YjgQ family permease [Bacteroidetes bacterium]|nr:YjgP/YjgQ family permease [Bacteroidota bacterium]